MKGLVVALVVGLAAAGAGAPVVAVAPVADEAGTGLANLGLGLGDMLSGRLSREGLLVVPPGALQAWAVQNGLLPGREAWIRAARALGAEVLLLPAVEKFQAVTMAFTLFLFTVRGASVTAELRAEVLKLAVGSGEVVRARGEAAGPTSVEVALHFPIDVCLGGFRTDKGVYWSGEAVTLGYRDPSPPNAFYVVIHPVASPTPSWTSPVASSTVATPCVTWTWNQLFPPAAGPGDYVAELYRVPNPLPIATRTFTIGAAAAVELVVGSPAFGTAPWGEALGKALDGLVAKILPLVR
ncbi:MAG: hypothetical protein N2320_01210 [Candidatus Bipolaricaulota bacterium]|nr:hypothetical protein [Candidatus Bipolaricaulota bacterium]